MKEIIIKLKNLGKEYFYVFALLLLALLFFHNIISSTRIMSNIHYINDVTFYSYNMKEAIKDGTLPLWTPYYYSGRPLFAQPEYYFIDFNFLLILLIGNIYLAMNFSVIIHLFIAGLGIYVLVYYLSEDRKAAFISALIYMFNGFMHSFVVRGNIMIIEGYSLIPFILFFIIKALKSKEFILYSVLAGIFAALLIFVGGVIYFPYLFVLIFVYSIIYIIDKNILNKIIKLAIVGVIILVVCFCVSAIKLLPGLEFMNLSNRGIGVSYQEYLGEPIQLKDFVFLFITNAFSKSSNITAAVGVTGFILLIFGLYKFRNRTILFSALAIILSLLMSSKSFLTDILFNVPIFNQIRHVERSIFLFAFASSILAGLGFLNLKHLTERYKKVNIKILFSIIVLLIFFELFLLQKFPQSIEVVSPNEIPVLDYMSKDHSSFRTINLALSTLIGATGYNYYSQLGISEIKGGSGIWFNDYLSYLIVSQNAPAKFWGVLNNKYMITDKNTTIDGLKYIEKFKDCSNCPLWEAFGPYLYENTMYLPRYYVVPNSVLVVGDNELVKQLIYTLMLQNWEPKNTVLIEGTNINDYDISFLKKFKVILLVKDSVDQNSISKLKEYVTQGGVIVPDILNGRNSISNEYINAIFNTTTGNYTEISINKYLNNKVILDMNGQKGWLVASERFAHFPGWKASINNNVIKMFKADNVITAIYLDGQQGELIFEYKPDPYKKGKLITIISSIIILAYLIYFIYSKKFKLGDKNQS